MNHYSMTKKHYKRAFSLNIVIELSSIWPHFGLILASSPLAFFYFISYVYFLLRGGEPLYCYYIITILCNKYITLFSDIQKMFFSSIKYQYAKTLLLPRTLAVAVKKKICPYSGFTIDSTCTHCCQLWIPGLWIPGLWLITSVCNVTTLDAHIVQHSSCSDMITYQLSGMAI